MPSMQDRTWSGFPYEGFPGQFVRLFHHVPMSTSTIPAGHDQSGAEWPEMNAAVVASLTPQGLMPTIIVTDPSGSVQGDHPFIKTMITELVRHFSSNHELQSALKDAVSKGDTGRYLLHAFRHTELCLSNLTGGEGNQLSLIENPEKWLQSVPRTRMEFLTEPLPLPEDSLIPHY